ncbi:head GIN domain-containing protein [Massilia sp. CF038]|uniref:head GIN domain-containing protein n=1 Tax=Massilia sp. CF038 TaxID=1881045 RepID=UPI000923FA68|nr:head GIN domain-containing protein [Massilia sp. CF038]SHH56509.1 Putative auto-transporter adhesin, head GIN domain [Massilia sp. CF038]
MRSISLATSIAAIALGLAGCAIIVAPGEDIQFKTAFSEHAVQGDGQVLTEARTVEGVAQLDMRGPLQLEVRVGEANALQVEADSNLLPLIRTQVVNGTLRVWLESEVRTDHAVKVRWSVPQLSQITTAGSGRLSVTGLNGGPLTLSKSGSGTSTISGRVGILNVQASGSGELDARELESGNANLSLAGSGSIRVGKVSAESLNVRLRGSGQLQATGAVERLNANLVGSGDARLNDVRSVHAELSTTGSGDISASVERSLIAQTTGSGSITVYGNPAQRNISGRHVKVVN